MHCSAFYLKPTPTLKKVDITSPFSSLQSSLQSSFHASIKSRNVPVSRLHRKSRPSQSRNKDIQEPFNDSEYFVRLQWPLQLSQTQISTSRIISLKTPASSRKNLRMEQQTQKAGEKDRRGLSFHMDRDGGATGNLRSSRKRSARQECKVTTEECKPRAIFNREDLLHKLEMGTRMFLKKGQSKPAEANHFSLLLISNSKARPQTTDHLKKVPLPEEDVPTVRRNFSLMRPATIKTLPLSSREQTTQSYRAKKKIERKQYLELLRKLRQRQVAIRSSPTKVGKKESFEKGDVMPWETEEVSSP